MSIALLVTCLSPILALSLLSAAAQRPRNLGVKNGRLAACPATPNCVSTQCSDDRNWIAPIHYSGSPEAAMTRLRGVIERMPRARIVSASQNYLHVEFATRLFGFVDDAEFFLESDTHRFHVRSASRAGYTDFGVNRQRVERIRAAFAAEVQR